MSEESVVHAIASKDTLETYFGALNQAVDECKLHMGSDGFHVSAVEPANVAMFDYCDLAPRAFEAYDAPGTVTIGINISRLLELLGPVGKTDLVEWNLNMETRKVELQYGQTTHSMALLDPDVIRSEPDSPDLDLPNEVVLEGSDLGHASTASDLVSDHLYVRGNVDERQVEFFAEGDNDTTTVAYGDEEVIDARVNADAESIFSQEYFRHLVDPIPGGAEVTIRFGDEFPLRMVWEDLDGAMTVQQMQAPRIQSS